MNIAFQYGIPIKWSSCWVTLLMLVLCGAARAQVETINCDGSDFGPKCSLDEMYNSSGFFRFTEDNLQLSFPFSLPSTDDFGTDLHSVMVTPLLAHPGVRIEPQAGTWKIDGNAGMESKSLAELRILVGSLSGFDVISVDQVTYSFETATTYPIPSVTCDDTVGGAGGFIDGFLNVVPSFFGNPFPSPGRFGGVFFSAPQERVNFRQSNGETDVVPAIGQIDFTGDASALRTVELAGPSFTVTSCDDHGGAEV